MTGTERRSDEHLAAKAKNGDKDAFGVLYARYFVLVFNKCLSFTKNTEEANDLAQDIMLRVMEKLHTFSGQSTFSTWLYAITFNYCTDYTRRKRNRRYEYLNPSFELADESLNQEESAISFEARQTSANLALKEISKEDQDLLLMKYMSQKSILEIQNMLNLSSSAVKMRLKRARERASNLYQYRLSSMNLALQN